MHVSRTCSCDSMVSVHLRHLKSLYFPLKLFFTSSILVLALKMVDASILFNSFMYLDESDMQTNDKNEHDEMRLKHFQLKNWNGGVTF